MSEKLGFISLLTLRWDYGPRFPPGIHQLLGQKPQVPAPPAPHRFQMPIHSLHPVHPIWSIRPNNMTPILVLTQNKASLKHTLKNTQSKTLALDTARQNQLA